VQAYPYSLRSCACDRAHHSTEVSVLSDKSKRKRKASKKDSQLVVRINKDERDAFIDICDEMDTSAAREVRGFIREFLKKHPLEDD
jgi:hypothetical protein